MNKAGWVCQNNKLTVVAMCLYADSDSDEVLIVEGYTNQKVWQAKAGDVSVSGHIVNGPNFGGPAILKNLRVSLISEGATLFIYTLL